MTKTSKRIDRQLHLPFKARAPESERAGSFRLKDAVREALSVALKHCPLSREEVADEISRLTGDSISVHHINNWVAECKKSEWKFPLEYAAAFSVVTGDYGVFEAAAAGTGLRVIGEEDVKLLEFGRIMIEEKRNRKKKQAIMAELEDGRNE